MRTSHTTTAPVNHRTQHKWGDHVPVSVNSLTSTDGVVPFNYYDLPYCQPKDGPELSGSNLGMVLRGDVIMSSPYLLNFGTEQRCVELCAPTLTPKDLASFTRFIQRSYRGNLIVDNLPAVRAETTVDKACWADRGARFFSDNRGFAVGGCPGAPPRVPAKATDPVGSAPKVDLTALDYTIHNHLSFTVLWNKKENSKGVEQFYVVGFYVEPESYESKGCTGGPLLTRETKDGGGKVAHFTYSVTWKQEAKYDWYSRWDYYLNSSVSRDNDLSEHWWKLSQSLLILMCLSGVVAIIIMRTLHIDFNRYNNPDNEDETQEEVGWKLVYADVFRPPPFPNVFAAFIGTGTQILGMCLFSIPPALMGFISHARRGRLLVTMIFLFVLMAFVNGYVTGKVQMMFGTRNWKTVIAAGVGYPGLLFLMWLVTEVYLNSVKAANAVAVQTVLQLLALWLGVCLPQAVLGASFAYRQEPMQNPLRHNKQERQIPPQRWMFSLPAMLLV